MIFGEATGDLRERRRRQKVNSYILMWGDSLTNKVFISTTLKETTQYGPTGFTYLVC